jgi:hypothetical protein
MADARCPAILISAVVVVVKQAERTHGQRLEHLLPANWQRDTQPTGRRQEANAVGKKYRAKLELHIASC